jgi:curved DNA-binding protein CbpA
MTDYFALLKQPRRPWLDPDSLKQAFHEQTLQAHPDAHASSSSAEANFALINEAYQTLLDPKRRLQHLLALTGDAPAARFDAVPEELAELFPALMDVTQQAQQATQTAAAATSALSRSLLTAERLQTQHRVDELRQRLQELQAAADTELQSVNIEATADLQRLYVRYSYLQRWATQLAEHRATLAL